ncbi:MAG: tetratricopeptide repeat protein, partial [Muribaculaceae bacterium]|nr:tetratricopeptide repeat protein [Muribaculaceae bacterium]
WLFPDKLHIFNISMSERVFRELVEDNRYHAAINLMEIKVGLIEESDEPYAIRMELADCYIHTGDYPKALEQYRLIRDWFDAKIKQAPPEEASESDLAALRDFVDICLLKEEYRIYLKMGDKGNISKLGSRLKRVHDSTGWRNFSKCLSEEGGKEFKEELGDYNMEDGFRLEIIQSQYFSDSEGAIREMEKYALNVVNTRKFNMRYKLRVFNELLRMQIEQGDRLSARYYLDYALRLVDNHEYNTTIYRMLGDLSEHCYALNDRESGLRLLKKYLRHIDDTYDREDIEYAVAHAKEYKYLESDGEWEELNRRVIEGSASLREQITKNFTGMTSAQREYFIEQFKPTLTYANSLMERHPSNDLAVACFENNIFLRGLLLRSETTTANTIRSIGDKELSAMYDRYVELSREMVARRYVS